LNSDSAGTQWLGAGSAYQQAATGLLDEKVFLGTFLFGGSCVFNVESFKRLGGYDEAMFVGFEDLDFSIRIFRAGMKVSCSGLTALVHDHPPAQSSSDADYERTRFSRQIIERSAKHLQEKYGFSIWSDVVEQWLESQTKKMTGHLDSSIEGSVIKLDVAAPPRPMRIALVVDNDDWAFANISRQIVKALGHKYQFDIIPHTMFENYCQLLFVLEAYDFVHIFWREVFGALATPYNEAYAHELGCDLREFLEDFYRDRPVTTSVYDHLFLAPKDAAVRLPVFSRVTGYTVSSQKLSKIYDMLPGYPHPGAIFPDGVDLDLFTPRNNDRFSAIADRSIVIGWVGNSKWSEEFGDIKGVNTILKPAIFQLQAEGLDIQVKFADRQDGFVPHDRMPKYYHSIDLYVCTSEIEGTPNPILEAMASGVPVISTDVGLVPEVFGPLQREFILSHRSVEALKGAIRRLYFDRALFVKLSEENLQSIKAWDWKLVAPQFDDFITIMTKRHRDRYSVKAA
jgi:glycosyltransferase involved in cell wall biosynthesis